MTTSDSAQTLSVLEYALYLGLGVSFHVLATPEIAGVPVRVGVSDMLLGATLVFLIGRYFIGKRIPPPGAPRGCYIWLGAMFALLLWAYLRVGIYGDASAAWARIKLVGFIILSAYFILGGWIASTAGGRGARVVARGFVAAAWIVAVLGLLEYAAYFYYGYQIPWIPRPAALAGNPNAFGIMLAAALVLELASREDSPLFSKRLASLGASLMLVAIFLSASRSAYVGLVAGLAGLTFFTPFKTRHLWRPAITAVGLFVLLFVIPPQLPRAYQVAIDSVSAGPSSPTPSKRVGRASGGAPAPAPPKENFAVSREMVDLGVQTRLDLSKQAFMMWWDHPVIGAGLGAFWRAQHARNVAFPYLNHNTALWLASEVGAVGLIIFFGGALMATRMLLRQRNGAMLAGGVAGIMFVVFGASVGTEVMYQRYPWFFCGLALGLLAHTRLPGDWSRDKQSQPGIP